MHSRWRAYRRHTAVTRLIALHDLPNSWPDNLRHGVPVDCADWSFFFSTCPLFHFFRPVSDSEPLAERKWETCILFTLHLGLHSVRSTSGSLPPNRSTQSVEASVWFSNSFCPLWKSQFASPLSLPYQLRFLYPMIWNKQTQVVEISSSTVLEDLARRSKPTDMMYRKEERTSAANQLCILGISTSLEFAAEKKGGAWTERLLVSFWWSRFHELPSISHGLAKSYTEVSNWSAIRLKFFMPHIQAQPFG